MLTQIVFSGGNFTGSSSGLSGFPTFYWSLETYFWLAGALLVAVTGAAWLFVSSDMGRVLVAIRENEARCAYLGIPVSRIKILLMVATAGVAAVAGFGCALFTDVVAPELTGFLLGTELLIWVALGGRGTLIGPALGAVLIVGLKNLVSVYTHRWLLILGGVYIGTIVYAPEGIVGALRDWRRWSRLRWRQSAA